MNRATRVCAGDGVRVDGTRRLLSALPAVAGVVTTFDTEARPQGAACTSFTAVTLDPPTLLLCLRGGSPALETALAVGEFALNILHEDAPRTAKLFAAGTRDPFERVDWTVPRGATGPHLRSDAYAVADCVVAERAAYGDHVAVFAEVCDVVLGSAAAPLLQDPPL